jgi:hypothetical protein
MSDSGVSMCLNCGQLIHVCGEVQNGVFEALERADDARLNWHVDVAIGSALVLAPPELVLIVVNEWKAGNRVLRLSRVKRAEMDLFILEAAFNRPHQISSWFRCWPSAGSTSVYYSEHFMVGVAGGLLAASRFSDL